MNSGVLELLRIVLRIGLALAWLFCALPSFMPGSRNLFSLTPALLLEAALMFAGIGWPRAQWISLANCAGVLAANAYWIIGTALSMTALAPHPFTTLLLLAVGFTTLAAERAALRGQPTRADLLLPAAAVVGWALVFHHAIAWRELCLFAAGSVVPSSWWKLRARWPSKATVTRT